MSNVVPEFKSEQQLQSYCVSWFHNRYNEERGQLHANNNNSVTRLTGNIARSMGVYPGVADLELITNDATTVFIEMKFGEGRLSDAQKEWRDKVIRLGFCYFVCRTFKEFKTVIETFIQK